MIALACALYMPSCLRIATAQDGPPARNARQSAANTTTPVGVEEADRLLEHMGNYLASAKELTFHADITFDHGPRLLHFHQLCPAQWLRRGSARGGRVQVLAPLGGRDSRSELSESLVSAA
jgi:hypothetical protein